MNDVNSMIEWMNESSLPLFSERWHDMNESINRWYHACMNQWILEWMHGLMNEWINELSKWNMNTRVHACMNEMSEWIN